MTRKYLLILLPVAGLVILFFALDLERFMDLEALQAWREALERYYHSHPFATVTVFIMIYIVQSALALPGPFVMSLAAGAIFGIVPGALYTSLAASIGASLAFAATRYLFLDVIQRKFGRWLAPVNAELEKEGFRHLLFLRLVPVFPFTLINIAAAMTTMPHGTFYRATLVGVLVPNLIFSNAGAEMVSITSARDVFSLRIVGSLVLMGLFALTPVIFRKMRRRGESSR